MSAQRNRQGSRRGRPGNLSPVRTGAASPHGQQPARPAVRAQSRQAHPVRVDGRMPGDDVFEFGASFAPSGRVASPPTRRRPPPPARRPRGGFGAFLMVFTVALFAASGFAAGSLAQAAVDVGRNRASTSDVPIVPVDRGVVY